MKTDRVMNPCLFLIKFFILQDKAGKKSLPASEKA
jgi:hypothetical protein